MVPDGSINVPPQFATVKLNHNNSIEYSRNHVYGYLIEST